MTSVDADWEKRGFRQDNTQLSLDNVDEARWHPCSVDIRIPRRSGGSAHPRH